MKLFVVPILALLALNSLSIKARSEETIEPHECLVIGRVGTSSRNPIHTDAIEAMLVTGKWRRPKAGDSVARPGGGTATWSALKAGPDGVFTGPTFNGGYAYFNISSDTDHVALLEGSGHSLVYVNGVPRTGDPYSNGSTRLPIHLNRGENELLFLCGRGSLKFKITSVAAPAMLDGRDQTLPDLRIGEKIASQGAIIVINATDKTAAGLRLKITGEGISTRTVSVPPIPPCATRKVGFPLVGAAPTEVGTLHLEAVLEGHAAEGATAHLPIDLPIHQPGDSYKETFISQIDGSVQYFAVNPARRSDTGAAARKPAEPVSLFLSLHGAGVEAIGQASAYYAKTWGNIVCPTNRRPYGFDWEDWGQMDAMEVLAIAQKQFKPAAGHTYLTGHSMGGHGTWHIGVTYPDRFAAIGPSAGWISFVSYAGSVVPTDPTPTQKLLLRCSNPSDTLALERNFAQEGVYIIHGDADDNVPVEQAREMKKRLAVFHNDVGYHEQPGAGHWWGNSDEPGAACVDWPPLFDFFAHHIDPAEETVRQVDFITANPGISATDRWVTIQNQISPLDLSSVSIRLDPGKRRFTGKTLNVRRLTLDVRFLPKEGTLNLDLDGKKTSDIPYPLTGKLDLIYDGSNWQVAAPAPLTEKNPLRYGPFKQALQRRMEFVYGTIGTAEENAWSLAKARYDAETFWYRGNGSIDVVSDVEFLKQKDPDRAVVVYGNNDTNRAYGALLPASPIKLERGKVTIGSEVHSGSDLACLFIRPRVGSEKACVAVIGGTGAAGFRLSERIPYFVSGVDLPDYFVVGPETLTTGVGGVRAAGIFNTDWSLSKN